ncbi:hypothetical protein EQV77_05860 [Halobacillus fulvus]|nr:hypothetical protein EQV77_05860 [Halobacillus fulvus]
MYAFIGDPTVMIVSAVLLVGTLFWTYRSFKTRKYGVMMLMGLIQVLLSPVFAYSIGPLVMGIGVVQLYMGIANIKRVRAMRHEEL